MNVDAKDYPLGTRISRNSSNYEKAIDSHGMHCWAIINPAHFPGWTTMDDINGRKIASFGESRSAERIIHPWEKDYDKFAT